MPKVLRMTLLSVRDLLATAGPFVGLALVLLALAYWLLDPTPPHRVTLATGAERSDYAEFGARYVKALAAEGITVTLRPTHGAADNLALLRDPGSGVDLAFVQGGVDEAAADDGRDEELVSLGSLFYEPVWLFYREDAAKRLLKADALTSLAQLPGWRVSVGAPGSGVPCTWPGPKAMARPSAPASTYSETPRAGAMSRATGQVSAQGQGFTPVSPARVRDQARCSKCCASPAFA